MNVDIVSAFAGDRAMTATEAALIRETRAIQGGGFYSDLIYAVSHHYVRPEQAEVLWNSVLRHKRLLSERLERNVRIAVAMLDYLSNIKSDLKAPTLMSEAYVSELVDLSMRDGMTGLFNHSTCYELLELELRNCQRYGLGVAVLLLDIDFFKVINDESGHQHGDQILVELAELLTQEARSSDICCRLGGDEFAVILRLTNDASEACDIAERVRVKAASGVVGRKRFTISVGVALCHHRTTGSARELMERADRALYVAKMGGRNGVVLEAHGACNTISEQRRAAPL